jgi:hypothetical protein
LVTFIAEPKSGSQEVDTRSNSDLMEWIMFRGDGKMDPHFGIFFVFYLYSSFMNFWRCMGLGLLFSLPHSSLSLSLSL